MDKAIIVLGELKTMKEISGKKRTVKNHLSGNILLTMLLVKFLFFVPDDC